MAYVGLDRAKPEEWDKATKQMRYMEWDKLTDGYWESNTIKITRDPIVQSVITELNNRSNLGITKYGKTLAENNLALVEWLQHAKEEALDLALYLETAIQALSKEFDDGK